MEAKFLNKATFGAPVTGGSYAPNPTVGLTATVAEGNTLLIWRPNGQLVTRYTERQLKISAIRWKEDGQFLAVGWSDGFVRLVGLESGKAIHHISFGEKDAKSGSVIEYIAWARNLTRSDPIHKVADRSWERLLPGHLATEDKLDVLDLPHELTFLEVDTALPKLSPLPLSGGSGDDVHVFSTRASLDFVFRPFKPEDSEGVDVMLVGTSDGGIELCICNSFVVATFNYVLPSQAGSLGRLHLRGHGSCPNATTHALLLQPPQEDATSLYVVPMDLNFLHSSAVNVSLLASKTTTLNDLLRYIKQTQTHMTGEWDSTRELPSRFIAGVKEDLEKFPTGPMTIVQALYHTVATGHVFPQVREWLVDSLAERGHKRWDTAVVSGLQNLRTLIHENLIPALERCAIVLSRLLGLARFHEDRDAIGFQPVQVTELLEIISCLTLVANKALIHVMQELDLFTAFSSWLRFTIDKLASSTTSDELSEREATMDNAKVLEYIRGFLIDSPLAMYLQKVDDELFLKESRHLQGASSLLKVLDRELLKQNTGQPYLQVLPNLSFLVHWLSSKASDMLKNIAEAERRGVRFGQPTELPIRDKVSHSAVRMYTNKHKAVSEALIFTAVRGATEKTKLSLFCTTTHLVNGVSGEPSTTACVLQTKHEVIDFKYLDDDVLLILSHASEQRGLCITAVPYRTTLLTYTTLQSNGATPVTDLDSLGLKSTLLENSSELKITQMEVKKHGSSADEPRVEVSLLGRDRVTQYVYALPHVDQVIDGQE